MRVKITRAGGPFPVAFDGIHITEIFEGEEHTMPDDMAEVWLSRGWVENLDAPKAIAAAPENKMVAPVENKADESGEPIAFTKPRGRKGGRK
jgi:hypothetical protein